MRRRDGTGKESGSLTVEAILFLIPFMCAFLTLVNIARFVQAEVLIHHAITQTAKQISTYSYVMTKTGIAEMMQSTNAKSEKFRTDTKKTVDSVTDFFGSINDLGNGSPANLPGNIVNAIETGKNAGSAVTDYFHDPEAIMYGALAMAKSGIRGKTMTLAVGSIAKGYMEESILKISDDPDQYLETIGIVDGMAGLDFSKSEWMTNSSGKGNIDIVVTYRMRNLLFPDFDFAEHEFCQCASTLVW